MTGISRVDGDSLDLVLSFLTPAEGLGAWSRTCRLFYNVERGRLGHIAAWHGAISAEIIASRHAAAPTGPRDRFVFAARDCGVLKAGGLLGRLARAFGPFERVMKQYLPHADNALAPPLPPAEMQELWDRSSWARVFGPVIPAAIRALYSLLNGANDEGRFSSVFGCYNVYNLVGCRKMIPFNVACEIEAPFFPFVVELSQRGRALLGVEIVRDEVTGAATLGTRLVAGRPQQDTAFVVAAPVRPNLTGHALVDYFVDWFEGVCDGTYAVVDSDEQPLPTHFSLFPIAAGDPRIAAATTRGVTTRVSPLVLYSASHPAHMALCAYQIQMGIDAADAAAGPPERQVQLKTRSWEIHKNGVVESSVSGEGVIGLFPVLRGIDVSSRPRPDRGPFEWQRFDDGVATARSGWFTYASLTQATELSVDTPASTSIGGHFRFEDLSTNSEFDVEVARCQYDLPIVRFDQ